HHHEGEATLRHQPAKREAEVGDEVLESAHAAGIADLLLHALRASERDSCPPHRLLGLDSPAPELGRLHLQMKGELILHLTLGVPPSHQRTRTLAQLSPESCHEVPPAS